MASTSFAERLKDRQAPPTQAQHGRLSKPALAQDTPNSARLLLSVLPRAVAATAVATTSALGLFLLSRSIFQVPYDWLNLAEVIAIPILVALPIAAYIFWQTDRLAIAKVALAQQARDNERQKTLIHELNHRVKNTLATVMSLCAHTARGTTDIELFVQTFRGRLVALAAANDVLCKEGWSKVSLSELSAEVLAPYGERIETQGPNVSVPSAAALSLSMVLHELATNAAKHGALSGKGTVSIRWAIDAELRLEWRESGGPAVDANPVRIGFGSRLIKQVIEQELGGGVRIEYRPEGLMCSLRLPAKHLSQVRPTGAEDSVAH